MKKKTLRLAAFVLLAALCLCLSGCAFLPARSDAEALDFSELAHVFALTDAGILERFGEPDAETVSGSEGLLFSEFRYGEDRYRTETHSGCLYYACLRSDAIPAPRDVRVGMRAAEVIARFASAPDGELRTGEDGSKYRLLYGDYDEGFSYGAVLYDGRTAKLIEYASEGCVFACGLEGDRVAYIEYLFGYFSGYTE